MLSPVLVLGPSSVVLSKPVVLTFRHCASVRHGQWTLSLIGSDSPSDELLRWQVRQYMILPSLLTAPNKINHRTGGRICDTAMLLLLFFCQQLIRQQSGTGTTHVCVSLSVFPHNISKTDAAWITKLDIGMFQDEAWKPF